MPPKRIKPQPSVPATVKTSRKRAATDGSPQKNAKRANTSKSQPISTGRAVDEVSPQDTVAATYHLSRVFACGDGSAGELGLGADEDKLEVSRPRLNPYLKDLLDISTGGMHAIAVTSSNKILTWGVNDNGALGRDTKLQDSEAGPNISSGDLNPKEAVPTEVAAMHFPPDIEFSQVAAGDSATFARSTSGAVYGWGTFRDHNGVYGFTFDQSHKEINRQQDLPTRISNLKNIVDISAGADFALALDDKGQVFAWGCGQQSELGRRLVDRHRALGLLPTRVGIPRRVKVRSIHAGLNHAFAIDGKGDTWAWGLNNFGQTGFTPTAGQQESVISIPSKVPSLVGKKMKMIAGGLHHSIGLTESGQCLVWGRIDGNQMGIDIEDIKDSDAILRDEFDKPRILLIPAQVPIPECSYVAAGSDHCLAVTSSGKAYSWGFNATNQCGQGTDDDIELARAITAKSLAEQHVVWAGAGGQYSMFASKSLVNGA